MSALRYDFVIGVDPGLGGGLALVGCDHLNKEYFVRLCKAMPLCEDKSRSFSSGRMVDAVGVDSFCGECIAMIAAYYHDSRLSLVIERQQAMPRQGVSSCFNNGMNYGLTQSALRLAIENLIPLTHRWKLRSDPILFGVRASVWKKELGLSSDKRDSLLLATKVFGDDRLWPKVKDEGLAEAALLGYWRLKRLEGLVYG